MRKDEFLQTLRRALNGNVPPRVVEENICYYDGYISDEVRKAPKRITRLGLIRHISPRLRRACLAVASPGSPRPTSPHRR